MLRGVRGFLCSDWPAVMSEHSNILCNIRSKVMQHTYWCDIGREAVLLHINMLHNAKHLWKQINFQILYFSPTILFFNTLIIDWWKYPVIKALSSSQSVVALYPCFCQWAALKKLLNLYKLLFFVLFIYIWRLN